MGTATMTASSARWCAREGSRGGNGVQGKRGEVQGARASPWRREEVGEAATAKQEVAGVGARASSTQLLRGEGEEDDRGGGPRWAGPPAGWAGLLRLGCTGKAPGTGLSLSGFLYFTSVFYFL